MPDIETAYNLALDYLYSFVDYSLKHSSELAKADFNLDRMRTLMAELGNPHDQYHIIHVAGTKGKGSVSALCASALEAGGYRVGLYTSPHLLDYCERIQINGDPISHALLVDLVEHMKPAVARIPKLTTFEITTALGFLYFAQQKANAAVIEDVMGRALYTIKDGDVVVKDGKISKVVKSKHLWSNVQGFEEQEKKVLEDIMPMFNRYYTVKFENYKVHDHYIDPSIEFKIDASK